MNCKYCKADCVHRGEQQEKECKGYIPLTNADRIRAMSDEELADMIFRYGLDEQIEFCEEREECLSFIESDSLDPHGEECRKCMHRWLKQPAME